MQSDGKRQSQMKSHWLPFCLSLSLSLTTFLLSLFLPSSSSLHFHAFSLLPLLSLPLIRSLLRASLCFIFSLPFPYLVPRSIFFSPLFPLLYSQRGNWNSFLQSICCHTNACASAMLCSSPVFPPISAPFPSLQPPNLPHPIPLHTHTHTHTSATFTHVQSAGCVTPSALWVWMHAFVCVCVCVCVQCELVCRDDIAKLRGQRQFWCIIKLDLWMLCNHTDPQKQRHTHTHAHTHTHTVRQALQSADMCTFGK